MNGLPPPSPALSRELIGVLRRMMLARRRSLLTELADIERMLGVGRFAGRDAPLADVDGEQAVDYHTGEWPDKAEHT